MNVAKSRFGRALVIMGAGASLEFGAPSTSELTGRISAKLFRDELMCHSGADQVYQRINDTLASYLQHSVTFEHVYHCAQEILSNTFEPTSRAVDEYKPILYPFIGRSALLNEEDALRCLLRRLPEVLFSELSVVSGNPTNDLEPLSRFVEHLRKDHVTRIYTTNYDDLILQAVPGLYYGFNTSGNTEPKHFDGESFWNSADKDCVFHLHGSVHFGFSTPVRETGDLNPLCWFEDRKDAIRNFNYNGSEERQMDGSQFIPSVLVTGFDKLARMQQTPYAHYFSSLARDAMRADIIYVIGFSLTDLHISARLAEARRRRPAPPLLFVDFWGGGFLNDTRWDSGRKEIEMLHKLRLLINGDDYIEYTCVPSPGWTMAKDGSCAVWDQGFLAFLNAAEEHERVVDKLARI